MNNNSAFVPSTPKSNPLIIYDQKPYHVSDDINELFRLNQRGEMAPEKMMELCSRAPQEVSLDRFITADPAMLDMKRNVEAIIRLPYNAKSTVLITGPTGTGKEIIARAFHVNPDTPFVARNCAAFPKDLIASLLFGHLKGTFTGADADRQGIFVAAKDGIVFLDEIGALPLEAQAMLLRVLQERVTTRLGAIEETKISCRVIAATKRNLRAMVEVGEFMEDLFARLMTFEIAVTGLIDRPDDIPLIALHGYDIDNNLLNYKAAITNESALKDIYKYNVRAIQSYVARMRTYGHY